MRLLQRALNLLDLASIPQARKNLGLGSAATKDVPQSGDATDAQIVLGNDSRLVGAYGVGGLTVEEQDGTPSVRPVSTVKVTNTKLTDNGSGTVSLDLGINQAEGDARYALATKAGNLMIQPFSAYAPPYPGADPAVVEIPYASDGTTSLTYNVRRIDLFLTTLAGLPSIDSCTVKFERSTDGGTTWADIGTVSPSSATSASKTSAFTTSTLASGNLVRANVSINCSSNTLMNLSLHLAVA